MIKRQSSSSIARASFNQATDATAETPTQEGQSYGSTWRGEVRVKKHISIHMEVERFLTILTPELKPSNSGATAQSSPDVPPPQMPQIPRRPPLRHGSQRRLSAAARERPRSPRLLPSGPP